MLYFLLPEDHHSLKKVQYVWILHLSGGGHITRVAATCSKRSGPGARDRGCVCVTPLAQQHDIYSYIMLLLMHPQLIDNWLLEAVCFPTCYSSLLDFISASLSPSLLHPVFTFLFVGTCGLAHHKVFKSCNGPRELSLKHGKLHWTSAAAKIGEGSPHGMSKCNPPF